MTCGCAVALATVSLFFVALGIASFVPIEDLYKVDMQIETVGNTLIANRFLHPLRCVAP